ncbi:phosphoglycerate mutase-like protein [Gymnopus androsaceus JB14]|uniref:Phosphoglycerate mutase-like protein n=1 Tax=Gymnopus androsaceus JB14 TaxID=1447944 RepID=A0A6A4I7D0_9AGAR|nr:phosphoglycerate mutase-like protein [Gymnopus androsaceus JB14]
MTLTVTFVRHGESLDNLKENWGGWNDAPLSDLGRKQAVAVGEYFASTKFDSIYASDLLRANATGQAIHGRQHEPFPSFIVTPKIREQHFGEAEGKPWTYSSPEHQTLEELFAKGIYPVLFDRDEKFPGAESLNDLAARAEEAIMECIVPHLRFGKDHHIALVSHGLCISEVIAALLRSDPDSRRNISYTGLLNTAWTRVTVSIKGDSAYSEGVPLDVQVTHVNVSDHLKDFTITSDGSQDSEARKFFGGGGEIADAAQSEDRNSL